MVQLARAAYTQGITPLHVAVSQTEVSSPQQLYTQQQRGGKEEEEEAKKCPAEEIAAWLIQNGADVTAGSSIPRRLFWLDLRLNFAIRVLYTVRHWWFGMRKTS